MDFFCSLRVLRWAIASCRQGEAKILAWTPVVPRRLWAACVPVVTIIAITLLLVVEPIYASAVSVQDTAADTGKIERLEQVIVVQQQQIEVLQQQVRQLMEAVAGAQIEAQEAKAMAKDVERRDSMGETAKADDMQPPVEKIITSGGGDRVRLAISGQVNRAVNVVDDGKSTESYFVDNDNSESRVNFVGTAKIDEDLTLASRIELTIAPNKAGEVSQLKEDNNNIFDQRWTELSLDSKRFGKVSIGKGATASYGSASVDLSRTSVISYATISDTAGGMLFRQENDDSLTDIRIVDAYNSFDGLNRRDRLRYDSPRFYGFRLSGSMVSDERYDTSLWWGGKGYGFKAAGAVAVANPNQADTDLQYDGSFSILHEDTGLNLTLSAGGLERDNQSDPTNFYAKVGWLKRFFSVGETAFGVDYTLSSNLPTGNDDGYSVGATAVQLFEDYGTELYYLYRLYSLDRDVEPEVEDISLNSVGARVKF